MSLLYIAALVACMTQQVFNAPMTAASDRCRCVPDQWEGMLASFDREFDLRGGRSAASDNSLYVHYDYKNRLFAMTDLQTGSSALADYAKVSVIIILGV